MAVPVADPFAELEDLLKAGVEQGVVCRQAFGGELTLLKQVHQVFRGQSSGLQRVVDAFAGERIDQAGRFADQQRPLCTGRGPQKVSADRVALDRPEAATVFKHRLDGRASYEALERQAGGW